MLFYVKSVFSAFLAIYSITLNDISSIKHEILFWISFGLGITIVLCYLVYLYKFVKSYLKYEFYKVHNLFRVGAIFLVILQHTYGMIALNTVECIALAVEIYLKMEVKRSKFALIS